MPRWGGAPGLLAWLLYGRGTPLMKGLRPQMKDVDFVRQVLLVRQVEIDPDAC
ncbi:hypothetical protein [Thiomonas bhubaneswarensis]|uniref:Uncharacterized protein n=1 Tax=Thiomonas bhubaneswarensis TaxID=339866 RepID=A0A0K6HWI2_9BURK|nr:hypothetical protein [Thiomonas bhubaneswarensis]CUA95148.1 hypothetical protein Ga0061069_102356 [Thiomonas bhubaneswarensis]